jgi:hypothetical protein
MRYSATNRVCRGVMACSVGAGSRSNRSCPIVVKGASGDPGARHWLILPRRIGPVAPERTTNPLFRQAGIRLTGCSDGRRKKPHPMVEAAASGRVGKAHPI